MVGDEGRLSDHVEHYITSVLSLHLALSSEKIAQLCIAGFRFLGKLPSYTARHKTAVNPAGVSTRFASVNTQLTPGYCFIFQQGHLLIGPHLTVQGPHSLPFFLPPPQVPSSVLCPCLPLLGACTCGLL